MISSLLEPRRQEAASQSPWQRERLRSRTEIGRILDRVYFAMAGNHYEAAEIFAVCLALEEALANAFKHGQGENPGQPVQVRFLVGQERVLLLVKDRGKGFDLSAVPDPREPENLTRSSGRGLFLMRAYMTWVRFNARGNCVIMGKCRLESPAPRRRLAGD
jgi:serine/threonine-protein kinase RsbW